jgi:CIC family chloride channel protein
LHKIYKVVMGIHTFGNKTIPLSTSLISTLESENIHPRETRNRKRVVLISLLAVGIAVCISFIAKGLVGLINLVTNISFHGIFSAGHASPLGNALGVWVILVPAIGGIIVGLMAVYGSKAIRGHGIPEAMEQVLINNSKIKPAITYLKPISAAIAIGTGGPFGAEGPIIATGGAMGSTLGQLLQITHHERKIFLAAGATAGMSAIFGSPLAAIFLAIELLLFEFSPRSIIPVALGCITGAAGHHFLFDQAPVFAVVKTMLPSSNTALFSYSILGIVIGLLAVITTKVVYLIEDIFEKIPVHWMWWPAIGGLVVGAVGYINPRTLGVGYENITDILSGNLSIGIILSLCVFKFLSWSIALGSGTSGGTLAPLLTIGGACGALLGAAWLSLFPSSGVSIPMAALIGMSAMFAGASRAFITSIIFALETTGQFNALLPLIAACSAAYFVSFLLMETTIMTEKIVRRGVLTPDHFEPDMLNKKVVADVMKADAVLLRDDNTVEEVRSWIENEGENKANYFIVTDSQKSFKGIISSSSLFNIQHDVESPVGLLIKRKHSCVYVDSSLKAAVEKMATENVDVLPIVSKENKIVGVVGYADIIGAYSQEVQQHERKRPAISLKKQGLKILVHGQRLMNISKERSSAKVNKIDA